MPAPAEITSELAPVVELPAEVELVRRSLPGPPRALDALGWLEGANRAVALSGAWAGGGLIMSSDPIRVARGDEDPFALIDQGPVVTRIADAGVGGGWFGWFGFGLARRLEKLPAFGPRPLPAPDFDLAFYDHLVRFDGRQWHFEALWSEARAHHLELVFSTWSQRLCRPAPTLQAADLTRLRAYGGGTDAHLVAVEEAVARIRAGELLQANLCLRLEGKASGSILGAWRRGVQAIDPPYAAFIGGDQTAVASFSPELFLEQRGRSVRTRPIKGTAPIDADPRELERSAKDRSENVMIVDLMRNDLGRVAEFGSVSVEELCRVEPAAQVQHLVSTVSARLRPEVSVADLLRATFPPGSVTGAPKVQALKLIAELEGSAREAYCGAVGLCSPASGLQLNVAIRTLETQGERVWLGAGGGVVAESSGDGEVAEALAKADGIAAALDTTVDAEPARRRQVHPPRLVGPRPDAAAGILETVQVVGGRGCNWKAHRQRLRRSAARLGFEWPNGLTAEVERAARGLGLGGLRVELTQQGLAVRPRSLPRPGAISLTPVTLPGGLGQDKWVDRRLIDSLAGPGSAPLFVDLDGSVLEAGHASALIVEQGTIVAPPLDGRILPSLSRRELLTRAEALGWSVIIESFSLARAHAAEAIVLSSALRGPHLGLLVGAHSSAAAEAIVRVLGFGSEAPS